MRLVSTLACGLVAMALAAAAVSAAPPPAPRADAIEALQRKLSTDAPGLQHRPDHGGYLPAVLEALSIPVDSQLLVFSKTSLQFMRIGPKAPRAIYFNDDTAVAAVQGGRVLEVMTTGADGKVAFYTLDAALSPAPKFERENGACLGCHAAADKFAPGMLVANVLPQPDGTPLDIQAARMFDLTDSRTPFEARWGGWYVTGRSGSMPHRGNVQLTETGLPEREGLNVTDLSGRFDTSRYLAPGSDIVALMTFEHQVGALNRMWRLAALERGLAAGDARATPAELDASVEDFVAYLLGVGEAVLPGPVEGVSGFSRSFPARGPRDARGRSLRDFDLQTRLFRYPVSYMVYSRAFAGLSDGLHERIWRRLYEVLSGADASAPFKGLDAERRRAGLEIVRDTVADLPPYWRAAPARAIAGGGAPAVGG